MNTQKLETQKKLIVIFSILIAIFTVGIVNKTFQNDTFFNISIGKYIVENGIDMKEHFCYIDENLDYGYSHWAFDILMYFIYNISSFTGIYIFTILFSILINITLFVLLTKRRNEPIISFMITLGFSYLIFSAYTARSQIISFLCFIIEIYCIEKFIETNKKRYAISLMGLSIIIANFHAATWPLFLVLFMPYIGASLLNVLTLKNQYKLKIKRLNKKVNKLPEGSSEINTLQNDIIYYEKLLSESESKFAEYKVIKRDNYNTKNLIILMIIILFTGLITPIKFTPYTYIINSMFGESNFSNSASIDYISEMQPLIPIRTYSILIFAILLLIPLLSLPIKIKREHVFLVLGLTLMSLISVRYVYLLIFLGSYVIADIFTQAISFIQDDIEKIEVFFTKKFGALILLFLVCIYSLSGFLDRISQNYVDETKYPVGAVNYIEKNLDYKNIRIYNSYNNGSYLMLHNIPVFIDSRLDVYCSEFNDTDIFYDYIQISANSIHYEEIFSKYNFTHVLLKKDDSVQNYVRKDEKYNMLYEDEYYVLYERNV